MCFPRLILFKVFVTICFITIFSVTNIFSQCSILRINEENPTCGLLNGSLTIIADGIDPIEYSIDNGLTWSSNNVFDGLPSGDFLVKIRDASNCTSISSPQLGDSGFHTLDISADECKDGGLESILTMEVMNGREPLTFSWEGPNGYTSTDEDPGAVLSGMYFVTVTDGGGCKVEGDIEIQKCCKLDLNCESPSALFFTCLSEVPEIDSLFLDVVTDGDEDKIAVEAAGIQLGVSTPCNDLIVVARDSMGMNQDCTVDTVTIYRKFLISDGPESKECMQIFKVYDNIAPIISDVDPDQVVICKGNYDWSMPTATDNCSGVTMDFVDAVTGTTCLGDIVTRTWTAVDECGNTSSESQTIEFQDTEKPVISGIDPDAVLDCENAVMTFSTPTVDDNCSGVVMDFEDEIVSTNCTGDVIRRTWTATDECGNIETGSQQIEIVDNTPPDIMGVGPDGGYACGETPLFSEPTVMDGCTAEEDIVLDFVDTPVGNGCVDAGVMRTWTATDLCGNVNTASQIMSVTGITNPEISTEAQSQDLSCENVVDVQAEFQNWLDNNAFAEAKGCGILTWSTQPPGPVYAPVCGIQGSTMVTFIVTDQCGNTSATQASFSVVDNEKPLLTCPSDITIDIGDPTAEQQVNDWLASVTSSDACSTVDLRDDYNPLNFNFDCGPVGATEITWRSEDVCGNLSTCSANIVLNGTVTTTINCPQAITLECDDPLKESKIQDWIGQANAINIDGTELVVTTNYSSSDYTQCETTIEVTFFAEDDCGVDITCKSDIILVDNNKPSIGCPTALSLKSNDSNNIELINNWLEEAQGSDDCSNVVITNDFDLANIDLDCGASGSYPVEFRAEDICGNFEICIANIEVTGVSSLDLTCPQDLFIECSDPGNDALIADWLETAVALDDNGLNIVVNNDFVNQLVSDCESQQTVTFEALDECGVAVTCEATIIQEDKTIPTIVSAPNLQLNIEDYNEASVNGWLLSFFATDECTTASIDNDFDINTIFDNCNAEIPVNFTAMDVCGNVANHTASITIVDDQSPELSCPSQLIIPCDEDDILSAIEEELQKVTYSDNGLYVDLINNFDESILDDVDCSETRSFDIDLMAIDQCDNEAQCRLNIKIVPELKVYLPNTFSPNEDGVNDAFVPYGNNYADSIISMTVYDRWGNLAYEVYDVPVGDESFGWRGDHMNEKVNAGVYIYHINILDGDGKTNEFKGNVTIIK